MEVTFILANALSESTVNKKGSVCSLRLSTSGCQQSNAFFLFRDFFDHQNLTHILERGGWFAGLIIFVLILEICKLKANIAENKRTLKMILNDKKRSKFEIFVVSFVSCCVCCVVFLRRKKNEEMNQRESKSKSVCC